MWRLRNLLVLFHFMLIKYINVYYIHQTTIIIINLDLLQFRKEILFLILNE